MGTPWGERMRFVESLLRIVLIGGIAFISGLLVVANGTSGVLP